MPEALELTPDGVFRLVPEQVEAEHRRQTEALVRAAAERAGGGRAAILGCGACAGVPLEELATAFDVIDLVDLDAAVLEELRARVGADARVGRVAHVHHADLTGLSLALGPAARRLAARTPDPLLCLDALGRLLTSMPPRFWAPADGGRYSLVICAAVLTQLQASARRVVEAAYLRRWARFAFALSTHEGWRRSVWRFARGLEAAFLDHVSALLAPGGVVCLSDTVHVWWLREREDGALAPAGAWVATRSDRLTDYLRPSDRVLGEAAWPWVRCRREGAYWGRLYGCQAVLYQTG
jgi:hypothetical protein